MKVTDNDRILLCKTSRPFNFVPAISNEVSARRTNSGASSIRNATESNEIGQGDIVVYLPFPSSTTMTRVL